MVGRLTHPADARRPRWRRPAFVALVALVGALHVAATHELAARLAAAEADARRPMPARIEVAYVRTLEPEAPTVVSKAPVTAGAPAPVVSPRSAESFARAASAAAAPSSLSDGRSGRVLEALNA